MKFLGRSHQSFLLAAASIAQGCKAKKSCLAFSQPLIMRTRSSFSSPSAKAAKKGTAEAKPSKLTKKLGAKRVDKKETVVAGSINESPWYRIFTKGDQEYDNYMATEWSFEKRGDVPLFEKISLEGAQSGLSWLTILRKRGAYRRVFFNFDINRVASMTQEDVEKILQDEDEDKRNIVVRHRGKIEAVINNAKCIQQMMRNIDGNDANASSGENYGIFDTFLWSFVQNQPILNRWNGKMDAAATQSPESQAMSKALKKLGFRFVGPTTCYAMMQSVGMTIDHPVDSEEWKLAHERLKARTGGYQMR